MLISLLVPSLSLSSSRLGSSYPVVVDLHVPSIVLVLVKHSLAGFRGFYVGWHKLASGLLEPSSSLNPVLNPFTMLFCRVLERSSCFCSLMSRIYCAHFASDRTAEC